MTEPTRERLLEARAAVLKWLDRALEQSSTGEESLAAALKAKGDLEWLDEQLAATDETKP